jgi:hypothetical protein
VEVADTADLRGEVDDSVDILERVDRISALSQVDLPDRTVWVVKRLGKVVLAPGAEVVDDDVFALVDEVIDDV